MVRSLLKVGQEQETVVEGREEELQYTADGDTPMGVDLLTTVVKEVNTEVRLELSTKKRIFDH